MKEAPPRAAMLALAIHEHTEFVLVTPHYPENVGAVARAIKTMGFTRLTLVKPSRIASPEHEMARKMAVKSGDVLDQARRDGPDPGLLARPDARPLQQRLLLVGAKDVAHADGVGSRRHSGEIDCAQLIDVLDNARELAL